LKELSLYLQIYECSQFGKIGTKIFENNDLIWKRFILIQNDYDGGKRLLDKQQNEIKLCEK